MKNKKKFSWNFAVLGLILTHLLFKSFLLHPTFSDENFYFNVAKIVGEGKVPYKDFFFAHPPLQVYILSLLYKVFGSSFILGKLVTIFASSACVVLLYLIIKRSCREKSAFLASILFLLSPPFLAFSSISYGMWESMVFLLLSLFLILRRKPFLASISFTVAIFFRYIAIFYLPLLLIVLYLKKGKFCNFLILFIILFSFSILLILGIFGTNYVTQTIFYHLSKKALLIPTQYFGMGLFFVFLAIISILIGFFERDKIMIAFALLPLSIDIFLFLALKVVFYHYFLLSIPFYLIAFSKIFDLRYKFIKFSVVALLTISIIFNFKTLDFYLNPRHSEKFYLMADFVREYTEKDDRIFGEPIMTNYAAFITDRVIAGSYLDSYIQHITFEGTKNVVEILKVERPKLIIEMESYYSSIPEFNRLLSNYTLVKSLDGIPKYLIYQLKG